MNANSQSASSFSQLHEALCAACDRIAPDALAGVRGQASATTKVRNDLFGIALRLMSSDGTFEQTEVDIFNELFSTSHTPVSLEELYRNLAPFAYSSLEDEAQAIHDALDEVQPGLGKDYRSVVIALCELISQADDSAEWAEGDLIERLKSAMA